MYYLLGLGLGFFISNIDFLTYFPKTVVNYLRYIDNFFKFDYASYIDLLFLRVILDYFYFDLDLFYLASLSLLLLLLILLLLN